MWDYLRDLTIELDSPIVQVFMRPFGKPWVVVSDFKETQDIQVNRQHQFDRSKLLQEVFRPVLPGNHAWVRYFSWRRTSLAFHLEMLLASYTNLQTQVLTDLCADAYWR